MLRLVTSSLLVALAGASFCGDSAIPFSLEILSDGQPVLGCARPTCFGWAATGKPASASGSFYRINSHADGFIRAGRDSIPAYGPTDNRYYRPQTAVCEPSFASPNCPASNQWVGGIAPLVNVSAFQTVLQCCTFDGLLQSEDRGVASLTGGQIVVGGEVISSEIQVAFDYISDMVKVVRADGSIQYDVAIRRMPCADLPSPATEKLSKDNVGGAVAFQAPNLPVDQPLQLPAGPPTGNAVLEEVIQEEAIQLPPGTQFQPQPAVSALQPPPPQFQPVAFQAPQFVPPPVQAAAVPQYYSPPVSYYGGGGGGNTAWCFSADMTVETLEGTTKRMDELKKGDWVLALDQHELEYVPVDFWLHRVPDQEAEFNQFETEDGKVLKLTDKHYIFKGDCSRLGTGPIVAGRLPQVAVTADQVSAGDCLYTAGATRGEIREVLVVRSSKVTQRGIYAPMTATGRIIVNGVHASCHNIMQSHSMGHTVFGYVDKIYDMYSSLFGITTEEVVETPSGLSTILAMADLIMPKNLITN